VGRTQAIRSIQCCRSRRGRTTVSSVESWIVRPKPNPSATLRVFCAPYAGAGVAAFAPWADRLARSVELAVVRLPGRESRLREPFCVSLDEAADRAAAEITAFTDLPCALFGHSMGALLAFELA